MAAQPPQRTHDTGHADHDGHDAGEGHEGRWDHGAHAQPVAQVAEGLRVDVGEGLAAAEVVARRQQFGRNELEAHDRIGVWSILVAQFKGVVIWLLAAAAGVSFALGDLPEGIAIVVVLAINGAIGFFTEWQATRSMEALRRIAAVQARVRRGGETHTIDAVDIVPGDVVVLAAGDVVPADLRLIDVAGLQADESTLTGESAPVTKTVQAAAVDTPLAERTGMAFKGTAVAQGSGEGLAVATGGRTELGRISQLAQHAESEATPLEKRLDQLGQRLVWLTLLLAVATAAAGIAQGREVVEMLETAIALAVAAIPEGLPVVATLTLARGMWRMAKRNALISRLSAVETLGATTVVLTDKTGTLTENRMTVVRWLLAGAEVEVGDEGWQGRGPGDGAAFDAPEDARVQAAVQVGVLCNDAELPTATHQGLGDPMERALLQAGAAVGLDHDLPERVADHPFDSDTMMMATVHRTDDGLLCAVKGAPEQVLASCTRVLGPDGAITPLDGAGRQAWADRAADHAGRGYRLLGLARKELADAEEPPYSELTLLGLVCLVDPVRGDVPAALTACRQAGVRTIMLTGDHASTAAEIALQAGLTEERAEVIEGRTIDAMDLTDLDDATRDRILHTQVFARVSPEAKLELTALHQRAGEVVAMTGDGVNDAPALKKADIGIAMGQRGTEVAREAAHMVLKDDAFPTIVAAMREGRIIYANIRTFVVFLMSCNLSEVLLVGLAVAVGLPTPLLPLQILYLNLITDVFPAFALALGRGEEAVMHRPPRDPAEPVLDRPRWLAIVALGGAITAATLAAFLGALHGLHLGDDQAVTVAFTTLALAQLWNVFNLRDPDSGWVVNDVTRNGHVWGSLVLCSVLIAGAVGLPWLSELLRLPDPGRDGLLLAVGASFLPLVCGQLLVAAGLFSSRPRSRPTG